MIAVSRSLTASEVSIVTVEAALSKEFGQNPPLPRWSPSPLPAASEAAPNEAAARPVVDRLVMGMAGAGHSVATLSLYLGLEESEVRERVAALDLPAAPEKPLRRWSSKNLNPWSVEEVRRLIALWLDNVSVSSIAGALGRTATSIHGKRRWLGLGVRVRKDLADRPASQCRKIRLPWNADKLDIGRILSRLYAPEGRGERRRNQMGVGSRRREGPLVLQAGVCRPAVVLALETNAEEVRRLSDGIGGGQSSVEASGCARSP